MRNHIFSQRSKALQTCVPEVIAYLKQKYGEAFVVTGAQSENWGIPADRFWARTDPDGPVFGVFAQSKGALDVCPSVFADAYYSVWIQPEYERFLCDITAQVLPSFTLRLTLNRESPNPDGLVKGVPVTEIHRHLQPGGAVFGARAAIYTPISALRGRSVQDALTDIAGRVSDAKLIMWLKLHAVNDADFDAQAVKQQSTLAGDTDTLPLSCESALCFVDQRYTVKVPKTCPPSKTTERLNDWQLERLCAAVYLDGVLLHRNAGSLGEITDYLLEYGLEDCRVGGRLPCEMDETEWRRVLTDIRNDFSLSELRVIKSEDVTEKKGIGGTLPGHRVLCFADENEYAYTVFRGTCGDDEWYDNAQGMIEADTVQQRAAARFVEELRREFPNRRIVTAGHSKGGNKAQYTVIATAEGCVDYCLALDGQGFSRAFLEKYAEAAETRKGRIKLIAERRDFVNCLGLYLAEDICFYSGRRGDRTQEKPHGEPLPFFHCPDALRDAAGRTGVVSLVNPIPGLLNRLAVHFLQEPRYAGSREDTAVDLIALLMKNKKASAPVKDTAEAMVNLAVVCMDLVENSETFRDLVEALFLYESDVLLATLDYMRGLDSGSDEPDERSSGRLFRHVSECLVKRVIIEPGVRKSFFVTIRHLTHLVTRMLSKPEADKNLAGHIFNCINRISMLLRFAAVR